MTNESERSERQPVIVLDHVSKTFGSVTAVDDVNLAIEKGEFFSLLGPSGCGKTTTLRMIAGFETPTSGRILLQGQDVSYVPPYRRNVNMVFQHYALFPHMNVFDNIAFGPRSKRVPSKDIASRVQEMLKVVRLEGFSKRRPNQLSGGQQQRVALARALVNYPSALLLDEPLGTAEEIYERPASPFVAGFIGLANLLPARVERADAREVLLSFAGGKTMASADGLSFSPGDDALVVLRPERMRIGGPADREGDSGTTGFIEARLNEIVFQGPVTRYDLRSEDGTPLVVVLLAHERPPLNMGDTVRVTWDSESVYILPGALPAEVGAET